jgi:hypothetical protein
MRSVFGSNIESLNSLQLEALQGRAIGGKGRPSVGSDASLVGLSAKLASDNSNVVMVVVTMMTAVRRCKSSSR